jgi:PhzF family phenazine biosynthesis protein
MTIPIFQVDAFTDEPFGGNPAAVCLPGREMDDEWMLNVAREMNLSETAFLLRNAEEDEEAAPRWGLRWFTPGGEVDLCGHATLAAAHVLLEQSWDEGTLTFDTLSGPLRARQNGAKIQLDFPAEPARARELDDAVLNAIGTGALWTGANRMDALVEVGSEKIVRGLTPDFAALRELDYRGYIVTAPADSEAFDFVSRCFYPKYGINEDPVTGSAHCALGPYWGARLGKESLMGYQASRRGGVVHMKLAEERIYLSGNAVTVLTGTLSV